MAVLYLLRRLSSGAGAFFSWVQSTSLPVFFDPYVDIASVWIETRLPWFSLTLRSDLKYSLGGPPPNLLGQGLVLWGGIFPLGLPDGLRAA